MARNRILIVDDDADLREVFSRALRHAGYEVQEADHALGAVCAMVRAGADLVVTDIRMPIMDGLSLVNELKAHEDTRNVPVVAQTGYDSPECRVAAFDAGCIGYITKPIDTTEFVSQIVQCLPVAR